jgi:Tyrosyl-tRNA synthetase
LTDAEILKNFANWQKQAGKILDFSKNFQLVKNADWLADLNFEKILKIAGSFTANQMFARKSFSDRIKNGKEVLRGLARIGKVRPLLVKDAIPYLEKNNLSDNADIIRLRKQILKIIAPQ